MTLTAAQLALQAANAGVQKLTTASNSATIKAAKTKLAAAVVPFVADTPAPPPDQPTVSPDKATAAVGSGQIVNKALHVFTVGTDAKVYVDDKVLAGTNGVDRIQYVAASDEVRQHNVINPSQPWWSTPITDSGYQPVADPNGSTPTPPGPVQTTYPATSWNVDPSRSVDFTLPGAKIPAWMWLARFRPAGFDWDYNIETANLQIDSRQTTTRDNALRLGIEVADAAAIANAAGHQWKYVCGAVNGKGGSFLANNEAWEFDCYAANWARGRWDGISIYGLDAQGNEQWIFELDVMEIDNSYGGPSQPNVTNPTENWHWGVNSAAENQTQSTAYNPPGDWTKPATYQVVRTGDAFEVYCNGIPHGAKRQMSPAQAALRAYPVIGCSVRAGYDSMPTGDGIVLTGWRTKTKA